MGKRKDRIKEQATLLAKKYDIKYTDNGKYFTIHDKATGKQLTDDDLLDSGEWGILKRKQKLLNRYLESAASADAGNPGNSEDQTNSRNNSNSNSNSNSNTGSQDEESGTNDEVSALVSLYETKLKEQSDEFNKKLKDAKDMIANLSKKINPSDVFDVTKFKWNDFNFSNQEDNGDDQIKDGQKYQLSSDIADPSIAYNMNMDASVRGLWEDIKYITGIGMLPLVSSPYVPERSDFEKAKKENKKIIVWGTTVYDVDKSLSKKDIPNWKPVVSEEYDYQVPAYNNESLKNGVVIRKKPVKWYNKVADITNGTELISATSISPSTFKALADIANVNPEKILTLFFKNPIPSINKQTHIISDVERVASTAGKWGAAKKFNIKPYSHIQYEMYKGFLPAIRKTVMPPSGGFLPAIRKKYGGKLKKRNN